MERKMAPLLPSPEVTVAQRYTGISRRQPHLRCTGEFTSRTAKIVPSPHVLTGNGDGETSDNVNLSGDFVGKLFAGHKTPEDGQPRALEGVLSTRDIGLGECT